MRHWIAAAAATTIDGAANRAISAAYTLHIVNSATTKKPLVISHHMIQIRTLIDRLTMALNVVGTLLIVAIMLLVNADVIGRGLLNLPVSGVPEMVSMSIVAIVFLQVAQTFRMNRLTRSDALLGALQNKRPRLRAVVELIFAVGALFIMLQLLRASWPLFVKSWVRNTFEGTIGDFTAPIWPVKLIILIGCTMLILQLIFHAIDALKSLIHGKPLESVAPQEAEL